MDYTDLYNEWFKSPHLWFNASRKDDLYLYQKYSSLININDRNYENKHWINMNVLDLKYWIGYIICHDQLIRHFNRVSSEKLIPNDVIELSYHILYNFNPHYKFFNDKELIFILLPLRHTFKNEHVFFSIDCAFNFLKYDNSILIKKFIKAAFQKFDIKNNSELVVEHLKKNKEFRKENFVDVLDDMCCINCIDDIHDINDVHDINDADSTNSIDSIINRIKNYEHKNIIISLSGGVDSMVCAYLFKDFKNVCAVHINYMNREETIDEEQFVIDWCSHFNIKCFVRRINEVKRNTCMEYGLRDIYEEYTNKIRFTTYKHAISKFENDRDTVVILGHNKDDSLENILSNMKSKSHYDNLEGYTFESKINNLNITRPLKNVYKKNIFNFAKKNGIPFLKNTTPEWCWRGQSRNHIVPILCKYGLVDGLFEISNLIKDYSYIIDQIIEQNISEITNNCIEAKIDNPLFNSIYYTKRYFQILFTFEKISIKSLKHFLEKVKHLKANTVQTVILNKNRKIDIYKIDNIIKLYY